MSVKKTFDHAKIYAIGNIARNAASFIMLPIYTRYLVPAEYGTLELLQIIIDITGLIIGKNMFGGIYRQYSLASTDLDKRKTISTNFYLVILMGIVGMVILLLLSNFISLLVFQSNEFVHLVDLFSLILALGLVYEFEMTFLRLQQKPWFFVSVSLVKLLMQLSLNIYFLVFQGMTVEGVIYSNLITHSFLSIIIGIYTIKNVGLSFSIKTSKETIKLGWPLVLASLITFYVLQGDRYFIQLYADLSEVGLYAFAYKFAMVATMFIWAPFMQMWDTERFELVKRNELESFQRVFVLISSILILAGLLVSLFVEDVVKIMSDEKFHHAYNIVPILVLAQLLHSLTAFCNLGIMVKGDTIKITYSMLLTALISTIGFLFLIPVLGAIGAAITILTAFTVRLILIYQIGKRRYDMKLNWKPIYMILMVSITTFVMSLSLPNDIVASIIGKVILFGACLVVLMSLPTIDNKDKQIILKYVSNPKNILKSKYHKR